MIHRTGRVGQAAFRAGEHEKIREQRELRAAAGAVGRGRRARAQRDHQVGPLLPERGRQRLAAVLLVVEGAVARERAKLGDEAARVGWVLAVVGEVCSACVWKCASGASSTAGMCSEN